MKVCFVTGTRAEFDLLEGLINELSTDQNFEIHVVVTGTHLSPEYGYTVRNIDHSLINNLHSIEMLMSGDSTSSITKSMGVALIGFADLFKDLKPDLLFILGDRYEILCSAISAMIAGIPICHHSGGELTEGLIDDPIRHSLTKMSHFHLVAAEKYKRRVVQMGEDPNNVFVVGGFGVDNILTTKLWSPEKLSSDLNAKFRKKNFLITYHPVTLEKNTAEGQINNLLKALDSMEDTSLFFTQSNADPDGKLIDGKIRQFCAKNNNAYYFQTLGRQRYLSLMKICDAVLGNSSSGLTEAPSFKVPTVNIGDRQRGRLKANSVIDCASDTDAIYQALIKAVSKEFRSSIEFTTNPYGDGDAVLKTINVLNNLNLTDVLKKQFYDI